MSKLGVVVAIDKNLEYTKASKIAPYSFLDEHFMPISDDGREYYLLPVESEDEEKTREWVKSLNGRCPSKIII